MRKKENDLRIGFHSLESIIINNPLKINKDQIEEECSEMSDLERNAEKSSRQVTQQMICHYLKKHVGDQFNAVVTGMADFGLFAEIDNFFVSGLIHVTDLPGDRYFHDKDANILRGRKTGNSDFVSLSTALFITLIAIGSKNLVMILLLIL